MQRRLGFFTSPVEINASSSAELAVLLRLHTGGALGIKSDEIANYCFPKSWPSDRKQRAAIIGDRLKTGVRFQVS